MFPGVYGREVLPEALRLERGLDLKHLGGKSSLMVEKGNTCATGVMTSVVSAEKALLPGNEERAFSK